MGFMGKAVVQKFAFFSRAVVGLLNFKPRTSSKVSKYDLNTYFMITHDTLEPLEYIICCRASDIITTLIWHLVYCKRLKFGKDFSEKFLMKGLFTPHVF